MRLDFLRLALLTTSLLAAAPAQAATDEEQVDDPKLTRRLGTRISWAAPPTTGSPVPGGRSPATAGGAPPHVALSPIAAGGAPSDGGLSGFAADSAGPDVVTRTASPPAAFQPSSPPRLKLGFRRFDFVRIGASGSVDGTVASEPFNSISIDVYPLSSFVRIGLSTQYAWQSGTWRSNGDYFAAESLSVGGQLPGQRVVPFAEAFAGIGYMRRLQFDRTVPTAYWQLGVDVGAEIYLARMGFVSVALGYIRPVNGFARLQEFHTVFVDTWSFKLGVGL